jgi:hypothetical protein
MIVQHGEKEKPKALQKEAARAQGHPSPKNARLAYT